MKTWLKVTLIVLGVLVLAGIILRFSLFKIASDNAEDYADDIDAVMVMAFNEQFLTYCGDSLKGSTVKSLISKVENNNATTTYQIKLSGVTNENEVDKSATYKVVESYAKNGLINKITIEKN